MADINKLKDKIKSTIYPNGKGAINASDHQAMLLDMADGMAETDSKLTELSEEIDERFAESAESTSKQIQALEDKTDVKFSNVANEIGNIKPIINQGTINNAADEEDLTSENNLLKLKDRSALNGMGYVIVRKNRLFIGQITKENTIYEIRYDIDLNGNEVVVPKNSVLKFNGGKLINGIVNGDNTSIDAPSIVVFDNITFKGSFDCKVNIEWFNIKYSMMVDNAPVLDSALLLASLSNNKELLLRSNSHIYVQSVLDNPYAPFSYYLDGSVKVRSGVIFDLNGSTIQCLPNSSKAYNILYCGQSKNVTIRNGKIVGDKDEHTSDEGEWGYGVAVMGTHDFLIENLIIENCWGDGICMDCSAIYLGESEEDAEHLRNRHNLNGVVKNIISRYNRRQGMSICGSIGLRVENCSFEGIEGIAPECGVDVEPGHANNIVKDLVFVNCTFANNAATGLIIINTIGSVEGVKVVNCNSYNNVWDYTLSGNAIQMVGNNKLCNNGSMRLYGELSNATIQDSNFAHIVIQDYTSTPTHTMSNVVFDKCNFKVVGAKTGVEIVNKLADINGIYFNSCVFDWSELLSPSEYMVCIGDANQSISLLCFNSCVFYLSTLPYFRVHHQSFSRCKFYNFRELLYIYDGNHDEFNFNDCEVDNIGSAFLSVYSTNVAVTFNLRNLKVGKVGAINKLITVAGYSEQPHIINCGVWEMGESYFNDVASQYPAIIVNGKFNYSQQQGGDVFPSNPPFGQTFALPDNNLYYWNGELWQKVTTAPIKIGTIEVNKWYKIARISANSNGLFVLSNAYQFSETAQVVIAVSSKSVRVISYSWNDQTTTYTIYFRVGVYDDGEYLEMQTFIGSGVGHNIWSLLPVASNNIEILSSATESETPSSVFMESVASRYVGLGVLKPILNAAHRGFQYFDININKPIWWTGEKWVDAIGTVIE